MNPGSEKVGIQECNVVNVLFFIYIFNVHVCVLPSEYVYVSVFFHHENAYDTIFLNVNKL